MNLSVKGSLLPISERWPPPLPPPPPHTHTIQGVSRPRSGLVSLPTSLVSLSCWLFSHWILQYLQRQNKAWAIDPPHLPRRFSVCAAVTGPLPALLCLRLCCGLLPGAGVPWNYLPSASGRGWGLTAGFSLLVPLFLCPLWEERLVGGRAGRLSKDSLTLGARGCWQSYLYLSDEWEFLGSQTLFWLVGSVISRTTCTSSPLQSCFHFMSEKPFKTWQWAAELAEYFQCHIGLDFLSSVSTD